MDGGIQNAETSFNSHTIEKNSHFSYLECLDKIKIVP